MDDSGGADIFFLDYSRLQTGNKKRVVILSAQWKKEIYQRAVKVLYTRENINQTFRHTGTFSICMPGK